MYNYVSLVINYAIWLLSLLSNLSNRLTGADAAAADVAAAVAAAAAVDAGVANLPLGVVIVNKQSLPVP